MYVVSLRSASCGSGQQKKSGHFEQRWRWSGLSSSHSDMVNWVAPHFDVQLFQTISAVE